MWLKKLFYLAILLYLNATVHAQEVCKGSLGEAINPETFGAGTNKYRSSALPAGTTTYTYSGNSPNDGYYTIVNSTAALNAGWITIADHTGDSGGYMMVVNASLRPDVFYTSRKDGLCPGTKYEFAAWIANIINRTGQLKPNITFTITTLSGTVLGSYDTNPIDETLNGAYPWKQYGLVFTLPASENSVIITMTNKGPGGSGNDLALDDITFRPCGPVLIPSVSNPGSAQSDVVCNGSNNTKVTLAIPDPNSYQNPKYQWQQNDGIGWSDVPGANRLSTTVDFAGKPVGAYQYRLLAAEAEAFASTTCRVISGISTITVRNPPFATASNSTVNNGPACTGSKLTLIAAGGDSYRWTGPSGFTSTEQSPVIDNISSAQSGRYDVEVTASGCSSFTSTTVDVKPSPVIAATAAQNTICSGGSTVLTASGGTSYNWSPAAGLSSVTGANPVASPAVTTTYTVTGSNGSCTSTATVTVTVLADATVSAGPNQTIIAGQTTRLQGKINPATATYYWTPADYLDDATSLTPLAKPPADIIYTLHAVYNCNTLTSSVQIKVDPKLEVPTAFSPNGDGINDVWHIPGLDFYRPLTVTIYTRSGTKVYQSNGYPQPWDGRYLNQALPAGTYYYIFDFKNAQPTLSGWIAIIR